MGFSAYNFAQSGLLYVGNFLGSLAVHNQLFFVIVVIALLLATMLLKDLIKEL